jgi:CRP/FNR family transcriptional regulator, cyclic AMP receptor protein
MTAQLTEGCLKPHPFLENCSADFLNHLEEFATNVEFAPGQIILHENDYADRFYLICEGKIALESGSNEERQVLIQTFGPGDILGCSWLFPPFTWHSSARALEPCKAVALNAAALVIRAEEDPVFGYELMKRISKQVVRRLQTTRERLMQEIKSRQEWDVAI